MPGYSLGSRLVVNNNSHLDRIGIRLIQQGALAEWKRPFNETTARTEMSYHFAS